MTGGGRGAPETTGLSELLGAPVDAVTLDVGGVLLLPDPGVVRGCLAAFGAVPDDERTDAAHYRAVSAVDSRPSPEWPVYLAAYVSACGVAPGALATAAADLDEALLPDTWLRTVSGAGAALAALAARLPSALVSNSTGVISGLLADPRVALCQEGPGVGVPVAGIFDSHDVGVDKPDPRIFHVALERLGTAPERTLHVGDTVHADIRGAQATGMPSAHVDPLGLCGSCGADLHVHGLSDLVELDHKPTGGSPWHR
jgi:putative hydrolase of the HAD superfamily